MTTLNKLENIVNDWAEEKGIFAKATPMTQMQKTLEEVEELADSERGVGGFGSTGV